MAGIAVRIGGAPRWAAIGLLGVCAALIIGGFIWWAFIRPGQVQDAAAVTKAEGTVAAAAPEIARESLKEVERFHEKTIEIRERTAAGNAAIGAAAGAGVAIPADVDAAGRAALCLHAVYRELPACTGLLELRAEQPGAADTRSAPAGR